VIGTVASWPRNLFKSWLADGRQPIPLGTWISSASPIVAEAMGWVGFDFLVLDMEHSPVDTPQAVSILQAVAGTPTTEVVVRLAWNDQVMTKRVLDAGAVTLMFPYIQTAEEAVRAVSYTRYPPQGVRGVAATHRASHYGTLPGYLEKADESICVIVQLETPKALSQLEEIARVEGVDALFIGPSDLSAAMGHRGDQAHPDVQAVLAQAAAACQKLGKPCGIIGGTPILARRYVELGYRFVATCSDVSMAMAGAREMISAVRHSG
jgi:2-keto-3-deoxy-L-rhamnonate aldolase RhmA